MAHIESSAGASSEPSHGGHTPVATAADEAALQQLAKHEFAGLTTMLALPALLGLTFVGGIVGLVQVVQGQPEGLIALLAGAAFGSITMVLLPRVRSL